MNPKFIQTSREQQLLFPPSIQDWLPEEHLARFVVDIVSQLNLQSLAETYAGKGFKAYHPEIPATVKAALCPDLAAGPRNGSVKVRQSQP